MKRYFLESFLYFRKPDLRAFLCHFFQFLTKQLRAHQAEVEKLKEYFDETKMKKNMSEFDFLQDSPKIIIDDLCKQLQGFIRSIEDFSNCIQMRLMKELRKQLLTLSKTQTLIESTRQQHLQHHHIKSKNKIESQRNQCGSH